MTSSFEAELRAALSEHAALMPEEAAVQLAQVDYRPRIHKPVRLRLISSGTAVAVCCAALAVVLLSSSTGPLGAPMAYADWSATPTQPTAVELAAAVAACNGIDDLNSYQAAPVLTGQPVLTDKRGKYVAALFASGEQVYDCISDGQDSATNVGSDSASLDAVPGPDQLGDSSGGGGSAPGFPGASSQDGAENYLDGLAGRDIASVTFVFPDRKTVTATVENGRYFAWWPNRETPESVEVTTSSGTTATSALNCEPRAGSCVFAGLNPSALPPTGATTTGASLPAGVPLTTATTAVSTTP